MRTVQYCIEVNSEVNLCIMMKTYKLYKWQQQHLHLNHNSAFCMDTYCQYESNKDKGKNRKK